MIKNIEDINKEAYEEVVDSYKTILDKKYEELNKLRKEKAKYSILNDFGQLTNYLKDKTYDQYINEYYNLENNLKSEINKLKQLISSIETYKSDYVQE